MSDLLDRWISHYAETHERTLPWDLVRDMARSDHVGPGLLTLAVAVAGHVPVDMPRVEVVDGIGVVDAIEDPAGKGWQTLGAGKRLDECSAAGIGVCHADGSSLPEVVSLITRGRVSCECTSARALMGDPTLSREISAAMKTPEGQRAVVEWWIRKHWNHPHVSCATTLEARIARARVANSRKAWVRAIAADRDADDVCDIYLREKRDEALGEGGDDHVRDVMARTERQILGIRRAIALWRGAVEGANKSKEGMIARPAGCTCQWEEGDSPCPVHGECES